MAIGITHNYGKKCYVALYKRSISICTPHGVIVPWRMISINTDVTNSCKGGYCSVEND